MSICKKSGSFIILFNLLFYLVYIHFKKAYSPGVYLICGKKINNSKAVFVIILFANTKILSLSINYFYKFIFR